MTSGPTAAGLDAVGLIVAETGTIAGRWAKAISPSARLVCLDAEGWARDLRQGLLPEHVVVLVGGLQRIGTLMKAVRGMPAAQTITWVLTHQTLNVQGMDAVQRGLSSAGLRPSSVEVLRIRGDEAVAVSFTRPAAREDSLAWIAAASAIGQLTRSPLRGPGRGVVVGAIGAQALSWFGGWARTVAIAPAWAEELDAHVERLDVVLVSASVAGFSNTDLKSVIAGARSLGARVIGLHDGHTRPMWSRLADLEIGGGPSSSPDSAAVPPMAPVAVEPVVFEDVEIDRLAVVPSVLPGQSGWGAAYARLAELAETEGVDVFVPPAFLEEWTWRMPRRCALRAAPGEDGQLIGVLRTYRAVVEDKAFHSHELAGLHNVLRWCAAAVPCVLTGSWQASMGLGAALGEHLARTELADSASAHGRLLIMARGRRAALIDHRQAARWTQLAVVMDVPTAPLPTVSIVIATARADFLPHLVQQLQRQQYPSFEVIIALHGPSFSDRDEAFLREAVPHNPSIVRVGAHRWLGDVLNIGTGLASGDIITKMDDDDWYGQGHLWDLCLALEESSAPLVGKATEFVYLGGLDITVQRDGVAAGRESRQIAGGTLSMRKSDLQAVGGWPRVRRAVDQRLIDDVLSAGGNVHRTHPFAFVLNRHGTGHTWQTDDDYFLLNSTRHFRGLRLDVADVSPVDEAACALSLSPPVVVRHARGEGLG